MTAFEDSTFDATWRAVREGRLRKAQLGAMWGLASHAIRSQNPAQIVLPTGVGKTQVLVAAPYLLEARRVLVVAPSRLVRDQLVEEFATLSSTKARQLLPNDVAAPRVAVAGGRATEDDWARWRDFDAVIGTAAALSTGYPDVKRVPNDLFDLVLFDEAHHLPAKSWTAILEEAATRAVLVTATPFRRDGKPLPGEFAFDYSLSQALADGVYSPVDFIAVEPGPNDDSDVQLARAAAIRLAMPEHEAADSRLLVRADRVHEAKRLVDVYGAEGIRLGLVVGTTAPSTVRRTLKAVADGDLQGFACVGALVEGFDFPTLKIAAYHAPHKNLGSTLQFVGRLARISGTRGEVLAVPALIEGETADLYRQDTSWADLLPTLADAALERERAVRRFVAGGSTTSHENISARLTAAAAPSPNPSFNDECASEP